MKKQNLMIYAITILLVLGLNLSAMAANVLLNPGFENGTNAVPDNWTIVQSAWWVTNIVRTGGGALQCNGYSEWGHAKQSHSSTILGGQTYTASTWGFIPADTALSSGWNGAVLRITDTDTDVEYAITNFITSSSTLGTWIQAEITGTLPANVKSIDVTLQAAGGIAAEFMGAAYFDDVVLDVPTSDIPAAPANLSASDGTSASHVQITWNIRAGATKYNVFRNTTDSTSGSSDISGDITFTTFNDTTAVAGDTYYYWVKAGSATGWSDFSSGDSGNRSVLTEPQNVSASDGVYANKIEVSWDASSGATKYALYRHEIDNTNGIVLISDSITGTSYDDTTVVIGHPYYYWVKAGDGSDWSILSANDDGYAGAYFLNVLQNPGFEDGLNGWTVVQNAWWIDGATPPEYVNSGTGSVQCNGWGEWGEVKQTFDNPFLANQTVTATVWAMVWADAIISDGWNGAVLSINEYGSPLATTNFINFTSEKGVWHKGTVIAELFGDTSSIDISLQAASVPDWSYCQTPVYFDDASLDAIIPEPCLILSLFGLLFLWMRKPI